MKGGTIKILIVEDDYRLASEWQDELLEKGYRVDTVSSSDEAILLLRNNYDVFIVDLFHFQDNKFLPDGGIKCISTIRKYATRNKIKSKIIVVTGYFRDEADSTISTARVTGNLGADYALEKPLKLEKIITIIEESFVK
jgi:ActR/RegA family two-component response regulator